MDGALNSSVGSDDESEAQGAVCAVRDMVTGEFFTATDNEAKDLPVRELHPLVLERVWAACEVVGFHRYLRRELAELGQGLTTKQIAEQLASDPTQLRKALMEWPLAQSAAGADTWDHFLGIQWVVARMERHLCRPLEEADWESLLSTNGNHAEVKATSDALWKRDAKDAAAFMGMELYLESGEQGVDQALPRCLHCRFVTQGMGATDEVRQAERDADRL